MVCVIYLHTYPYEFLAQYRTLGLYFMKLAESKA